MKKILMSLLVLLTLSACNGGSSASIEGQWKLVSYNQTSAVADVETNIEFDNEGRMTGNVGCNGFGGEYRLDGDMIIFSPIETTLMFCEGPVGEQELATLATLQEMTSFELNGNVLAIISADGSSSIVLERK